jgi:hypothetical protein
MMAELPELGCELDGWYFGTPDESPFLVQDITYDLGEIRTGDNPAPREHGVRFSGRDLLDGQTIIISVAGLDSPGVDQLDHYGEFRDKWRELAEQGSNGGLSVLRMGRAGRTRRVYGRARDWLPTMGQDTAGHTVITAQFKCVDDLFYGDNEYSLTTNFLQPADGGFRFPAVFPWSTEGTSVSQGVLRVGGRRPVWPCFKVIGPITRPVVQVVGVCRIALDLTLAAGEWVGIDSRPWSRGVRLSSGVDVTPSLLPGSPQLSKLRLKAGGYEVVLRGQDPSGTAQLVTAWRETFTGP